MTVLLAPDKFKGSLTARQVVEHLGHGLRDRGVAFRGLPLADGGDGSVAAAIDAGFTPVEVAAAGPTGRPRRTLIAFDGRTAVVEVAGTCGLAALPGGRLEPLRSSTYGVGLAVRAALERGATRLVLAAGGSASTDGGAGLLAALGMTFRDARGGALDPGSGRLLDIAAVDTTGLIDLHGVELVVASDVRNPLFEAATVYGPQKGADPAQVQFLTAGLRHLVDRLTAAGFRRAAYLADQPGAGSAGGLGFAGLFLGGRIVEGAEFFLDLLNFGVAVRDCDLVVTGEGRMDGQTRHGKLPAAVARRAGDRPVIAVVGRSAVDRAGLAVLGIDRVYALADHTDDDPAGDATLSARLLRDLGRTINLSTHPQLRH
jgi:glycerate kinase